MMQLDGAPGHIKGKAGQFHIVDVVFYERTCAGPLLVGLLSNWFVRHCWNGEMKSASSSRFGIGPSHLLYCDRYPVQCRCPDNLFCRVTLEYFKDPHVVLGGDANTVVADGKGPFIPVAFPRTCCPVGLCRHGT
jgi:hypothetical protein